MKRSETITIKADRSPAITDESAHESSALEWWFVQGYYEGPHCDRCCFMSSLFRQNVAARHMPPVDGFSLLLSVLDPGSARSQTLSQIDAEVVALYVRLSERLKRSNLDPRLVDACIREGEAFGPPRPIRLEKAKADLSSDPFSVSWKDFSLSNTGDRFAISFVEPESRARCQFYLHPTTPRLHVEGIGPPGATSMAYVTYPQDKRAQSGFRGLGRWRRRSRTLAGGVGHDRYRWAA